MLIAAAIQVLERVSLASSSERMAAAPRSPTSEVSWVIRRSRAVSLPMARPAIAITSSSSGAIEKSV